MHIYITVGRGKTDGQIHSKWNRRRTDSSTHIQVDRWIPIDTQTNMYKARGHSLRSLCSFLVLAMLIPCARYAHSLRSLCSFLALAMLIPCARYAHSLCSLCSFLVLAMLIPCARCAHYARMSVSTHNITQQKQKCAKLRAQAPDRHVHTHSTCTGARQTRAHSLHVHRRQTDTCTLTPRAQAPDNTSILTAKSGLMIKRWRHQSVQNTIGVKKWLLSNS